MAAGAPTPRPGGLPPRPLRFTAVHDWFELSEDGAVAARTWGAWRSAVCDEHEMRRGRHYATFTLRTLGGDTMLGVVGAGFDPSLGNKAQSSPQGWVLATHSGSLRHESRGSEWEGQPGNELKEGDVVVRNASALSCRRHSRCRAQGMLLDLDAATLTVWVNGERMGVMVRPGMTDRFGRPVARLEGPLRWAVDLNRAAVAISAAALPSTDTAEPRGAPELETRRRLPRTRMWQWSNDRS